MFDDFPAIKKYFDALNLNRSHFVNSNDICTPMDCVKEMFDSLPDIFWENPHLKILDSCCGNGNFHAYAALKTNLNHLYFNEINEKRIQNVKKYFGENINLTQQDFLEFDETPQFDLIVSNPPYAKFNGDKRVSKNHNLSRDFIKKALKILKDDGFLLFIVPNNWMSFSDRNLLPQTLSQYQFKVLDIGGAKKYFPQVGSSFTWFLLQKTPNKNAFEVRNHYVLKDTQMVKIAPFQRFIPLYHSQIVQNIINKTLNADLPKYKVETSSHLHRHTQKKYLCPAPDLFHPYKLIHTPSQVVYSEKPHIYQKGFKVFISLTNQFGTFIDDCGMTQSVAFIRCQNFEEAQKIKKELENPVYLFLNNITRYGNFNNIRVLQNFPKWGTFSLNEEENHLVETFNRAYYGKTQK